MTAGDTRVRADVRVDGVVQGVGFRPFVYRTAVDRDLAGWVRNVGDAGVRIALEGSETEIDAFLTALRTENPPLSSVDTVEVDRDDPDGLDGFEIRESADADGGSGTIPPDTGTCDRCLADLRDPDSRYYRYWATSCVDCGPRYTVIRELPYDRPTTAMDAFPMCDACREEYEDPTDRRYHAQTIACPDCGPTLSLLAASDGDGGDPLPTGDEAVREMVDRLDAGAIAAVKGIGGAHLICDATDPAVVERLRDRTKRPAKPFAVMAPDVESVERFATVSDRERETLRDVRRPILLLEHRGDPWLDAVAPGLHTVGVMLPYAGLHHLLFEGLDRPLVMTSANRPGRPMCTSTGGILDRLDEVVDVALGHDREIVMRCDDSVARVIDGDRRFVRRSRGWVPEPLPRPAADGDGGSAPDRPSVLALGPEFDVTVAVTQGEAVVPSQYVGDVDDPATLAYLDETVEHLLDLAGARPETVACDLHPGFLTTERAEAYARDGNGAAGGDAISDALGAATDVARVQHHHAHAASLLGERGRDRAVVIAADGTGYGPDGTVWGGEVLDATCATYERMGGLDEFALPGGEAAVRRPARILASLLADEDRVDELLVERDGVDDRAAAANVRRQVERSVNAPTTTSAGRALDAVSALLGVCTHRRYEGEPAMRLEAAAAAGTPLDWDVPYATRDGRKVVDVRALVRQLADRRFEGDASRADLAATAQRTLAVGLADVAIDAAAECGVDTVGFTGGVACNEAMTRTVRERVEAAGRTFLGHDRVPPGDGGIAYGQVVVADAREP